jgi:acetyltransferase-like isoleucine patch superfamily enzyme
MSETNLSTNGANPPAPPSGSARNWYRTLATSQKPFPKFVRKTRRAILDFTLPAPKVIVKPALVVYLAARTTFHWAQRVFIAEPLFKAYCKKYGRGVHTNNFVHWIMGKGDIVLGDHVVIGGKIWIGFGARFADNPLLEVGDYSEIGHDCRLVIGKRITIGKRCNLSPGTIVMDSNGHPADPLARIEHKPPAPEDVRPVVIGDGVWIGMHCIIFPGVKIGEGSIVSAGSIVRTHVPPYSVVAGNPARVMFRLKKPDAPLVSK